VQLHRIGVEDIASILGTVRSEFANVWLYFSGMQGIIVACSHSCEPTPAMLDQLERTPALRVPLSSLEGRAARLVGDRMLSPTSVDNFLHGIAEHGLAADELVSTDDHLFLEYNTPRGNVREYDPSLRANVALLRTFTPPSLTEGTQLTEADLKRARFAPETGGD
jgi:spermidine synthase